MDNTPQTYHVCVHTPYAKTWRTIRALGDSGALDKARTIAGLHAPNRVTLHSDPDMPATHTWNWAPQPKR